MNLIAKLVLIELGIALIVIVSGQLLPNFSETIWMIGYIQIPIVMVGGFFVCIALTKTNGAIQQ